MQNDEWKWFHRPRVRSPSRPIIRHSTFCIRHSSFPFMPAPLFTFPKHYDVLKSTEQSQTFSVCQRDTIVNTKATIDPKSEYDTPDQVNISSICTSTASLPRSFFKIRVTVPGKKITTCITLQKKRQAPSTFQLRCSFQRVMARWVFFSKLGNK